MDGWQTTYLGRSQLSRELTAFEIEAFFSLTAAERGVIEVRRRPEHKARSCAADRLLADERQSARFGAHGARGSLAASR